MKHDKEVERIIDSFAIDPDNRMLNFPWAIKAMITNNISPLDLINYIDYYSYWAINGQKYEYLNNALFAYRVTEDFYKRK